jgi:hypothetical protein
METPPIPYSFSPIALSPERKYNEPKWNRKATAMKTMKTIR